MKYSPELYAEAFLVILRDTPGHDESSLVERFIRTIEKNGDIGRREKIFAAIRRACIKKNGGREVVIETARRHQRLDFNNYFKKEDAITTAINPDLIAGVRVTIDGERELDTSLNHKLSKMF